MSYVIDVYRGHVAPQRNALYLGMYIAMFPQLVAGPIVRYSTIEEQVLDRREDLRGFSQGVRLFAVGLAKKCLLANTAAILADQMLADGGVCRSRGRVGRHRRLHVPDILRLQRLFRYGHRPRHDVRLPLLA